MSAGKSDESQLPLLALRGLAVLPGVATPLHIGRRKSLSAVNEAMAHGRRIIVVTQKNEADLEPDPKDIHHIGALAEISNVARESSTSIRATVQGLKRIRILKFVATEPHFRVVYQEIPDEVQMTPQLKALMRGVLKQYEEFARLSKKAKANTIVELATMDAPGMIADLIAGELLQKAEDRVAVLATTDVYQRLESVYEALTREVELLKLEKKIQQRVSRQVEKTQREYYLREQLRAIQQELGEYDIRGDEIAKLREQIAAAQLPDNVEEQAYHELERLERMQPLSQEAVVVRNYLDWLIALPWNKRTEDTVDLDHAQRVLDEDHHGLDEVKDRILEYLAVRQLAPETNSPILCFAGPPGVGKTSLGRSIAKALGRRFVRISLGGIRDEAEIRGHRRTYVGAMPGRIIQGIRQAGSCNPVFLLDEIDKIGSDFRGDPAAALLEALDPEQNCQFSDHYLELPFDLSQVIFITTANLVQSMPPALVDRLEVIHLPGYTEYEKGLITTHHLWPRQMSRHGIKPEQLAISANAVHTVISGYTREAGVRHLERQLARICRKAARQISQGERRKIRITTANLHKYLGLRPYHDLHLSRGAEVGMANALAWTEAGGQVMPVEVAVLPGQAQLILTGQLGDVMRESAQAAVSYIRSRWRQLGLSARFYRDIDVHIHLPEGAVPKDGPSAGIAMVTALASAVTNQAVRGDLAMTGEVTIRGRVLPVGGVKEKVLAAHRAGMRAVVLPKANAQDLVNIPAQVKKSLRFHLVEHMDEVLKLTLVSGAVPRPGGTMELITAGHGRSQAALDTVFRGR